MRWLFLRGLARDSRHWLDFPRHFERHVTGAEVHCLDLPGVGARSDVAAPTRVTDMAFDVAERWLSIDDGEAPWGILGLSLGGMVTLELCRRYSDRIAAAVVVNASANESLARRARPKAWPVLLHAACSRDAIVRESTIYRLTTAGEHPFTDLAWETASHPPRRINVVRQLVAAARFEAPEHLETPLLFLSGLADRLVHPICSEHLAARYAAEWRRHMFGGHDLPLDAPLWICHQVRDWLEGSREPTPRAKALPLQLL
jgi:pimeloyl-ACP methyl ester carboxylesterase